MSCIEIGTYKLYKKLADTFSQVYFGMKLKKKLSSGRGWETLEKTGLENSPAIPPILKSEFSLGCGSFLSEPRVRNVS